MKKISSLSPTKRKITSLIASAGLILVFTSCNISANDVEPETEDSAIIISSFYGYDWGTSLDNIKVAEITADMREGIDYYIEPEVLDGIDQFELDAVKVGGYETTAYFYIENGKLVAGEYDIKDDQQLAKLKEKYIKVYGEPTVSKESIGWGACCLWIDEQKNFIIMSELSGIMYVSNYETAVTDDEISSLDKYHGIDLKSELDAVNNMDGI